MSTMRAGAFVESGSCGMFLVAEYCMYVSSLVIRTTRCAVTFRMVLDLSVCFSASVNRV
jgi:hypothetical protein